MSAATHPICERCGANIHLQSIWMDGSPYHYDCAISTIEGSTAQCARYANANAEAEPEVPAHYLGLGMQPWDVFRRGWLTREEFIGHLRGSALEYVARAPHKNGADDYRKAIICLEKLVSVMAETQNKGDGTAP